MSEKRGEASYWPDSPAVVESTRQGYAELLNLQCNRCPPAQRSALAEVRRLDDGRLVVLVYQPLRATTRSERRENRSLEFLDELPETLRLECWGHGQRRFGTASIREELQHVPTKPKKPRYLQV
jgi:hypothetical protein